MNKNLILLCCLAILIDTTNTKKIQIEILFEALCNDSIEFITQNLYSNWDKISPYVEINFVPFGKAFSYDCDDGVCFECQHGPDECYGNRLMSCVLDKLHDQNRQMEFVNCFMEKYSEYLFFNSQENTNICLEDVGLKMKTISSCLNSDTGDKLQLKAEKITKSYEFDSIPTIIFNKVQDESYELDSLNDILIPICKLIQNESNICNGMSEY